MMTMRDRSGSHRCLLPFLLLLAAGCNAGGGDAAAPAAAPDAKAEPRPGRSPGKPAAPVEIRYQVLGTPLVGQPVAIELTLVAAPTGQPLRLSYYINDPESLRFAEAEPQQLELSIDAAEGSAARQVTVVPLREGRLYLNVTAEIATDAGFLLKSIAVPLSVGYAEGEPAASGKLEQGADGESVVSMPAAEN